MKAKDIIMAAAIGAAGMAAGYAAKDMKSHHYGHRLKSDAKRAVRAVKDTADRLSE